MNKRLLSRCIMRAWVCHRSHNYECGAFLQSVYTSTTCLLLSKRETRSPIVALGKIAVRRLRGGIRVLLAPPLVQPVAPEARSIARKETVHHLL
eukprot:scaffold157686_cov30-Tisochrysis_lutea.AAC.2